jgi:membrane protein implicated in regulation of membrane protease activity
MYILKSMDTFLQLILDNLPWFWVAVTVICIIIESCTMGLTTIWFGCGAFVMVFVSLTPLPFKWQLLLFVVISCVLLFSTRPIALKKFQGKHVATNTDALIGQKAVVTEQIEPLKKGAIKINGLVWTAKSADDKVTLEPGNTCTITAIEGATAVVNKD